jgi:hypothetical protein
MNNVKIQNNTFSSMYKARIWKVYRMLQIINFVCG